MIFNILKGTMKHSGDTVLISNQCVAVELMLCGMMHSGCRNKAVFRLTSYTIVSTLPGPLSCVLWYNPQLIPLRLQLTIVFNYSLFSEQNFF